jgi:hypothetical protein
LPRKNIWLATAISVAVIIPSYAVSQVMSASSVAVNAHLFAADFHDDVIRVKNDIQLLLQNPKVFVGYDTEVV